MIARYDGFCSVTNQRIYAGVTEIAKKNGRWQVAQKNQSGPSFPQDDMISCVIFDGPVANIDKYGDEYPEYVVMAADDDGFEIGEPGMTFTFSDFESAEHRANQMADFYNVELVHEASEAY